MGSFKCENVSGNWLTAKMPEPPKEIEGILQEYQDFLGSVFAKDYKEQHYNPLGTAPIYFPKLNEEEMRHIETLTKRLQASPGWKEYTKQCRRWAILM